MNSPLELLEEMKRVNNANFKYCRDIQFAIGDEMEMTGQLCGLHMTLQDSVVTRHRLIAALEKCIEQRDECIKINHMGRESAMLQIKDADAEITKILTGESE